MKLKRNVGLVIIHRMVTAEAVLCATCAAAATKQFQRETLTKGWTSPRSALSNPATIAGNAIRKKRHERKIREQADSSQSQVPTASRPSQDDPSDLLLVLGGVTGVQLRLLQSVILDFQGGGITSTAEQVEAAQKIPNERLQQEMGDIALSVLEGLEAAEGNQQFEAILHGILVTGLWDLLKMSSDDLTDTHRALSGATLEAASQLRKLGRDVDAKNVLLMGQMLYANASD